MTKERPLSEAELSAGLRELAGDIEIAPSALQAVRSKVLNKLLHESNSFHEGLWRDGDES